jgi:3-carboxy-cis,cis-muconate cycloisomerase
MSGHDLLNPGGWRTASLTDDSAVIQALLDVEVAWVRAQRSLGLVDDAEVRVVEDAGSAAAYDVGAIARRGESGGNPVLPLLSDLRSAVGERSSNAAGAVHRGLTSQDVLDSALMLVASRTLGALVGSLLTAGDALARLADEYRATVMVGRTLGQAALPITFGLKAAGWLGAVTDTAVEVRATAASLPVQCGGAVGSLAAIDAMVPGKALRAAELLADELGLSSPGRPWHTDRGPVTRCGDAMVRAADVMGKIASDILILSRPEIGELAEPVAEGRGGSSTLPQKRNPVLSVLIRSVAIEAPHCGAMLHTAAALAVDERSDGAWHSEWSTLVRLLARVSSAGSQLEELLGGLQVNATQMRHHVDDAGPALLSERLVAAVSKLPDVADTPDDLVGLLKRGASTGEVRDLLRSRVAAEILSDVELDRLLDPTTYLGVSDALIDRALERYRALDSGDRR